MIYKDEEVWELEIKELQEKLKRELKDNNELREYIGKYRQTILQIKKVIEHGIAEDGFDDQPETMCFDIEKILKEVTL